MAQPYQLSFLSRGPLFEDKTLRQYLKDKEKEYLPDFEARRKALFDWVERVRTSHEGRGKGRAKETSLEQAFNSTVLGTVLGYTFFPPSEGTVATAYVKPPTALTGIRQEPDVALGAFTGNAEGKVTAVVELKRPYTPLDAPQARESHLTPVEQAFECGTTILGTQWVLVTDMLEVRLYSVESPNEFMRFNLHECATDFSGDGAFRQMHFLLHADYLVARGTESATSNLLRQSRVQQQGLHDSFYVAYYQIRADLIDALRAASEKLSPVPDTEELLSAVQRLLDRLLFLFYCEDAPDPLIPRGYTDEVVKAALRLPGRSGTKVYEALKDLFRVVDEGSGTESEVQIPGYNGELFKPHRIVDAVELPDALARKAYGRERRVEGVWGLHAFNFWSELNEHLLGRVFEESLSDMVALRQGGLASLGDKLGERRQKGIYYTSEIISDYLAASAIKAFLDEAIGPSLKHKPETDKELRTVLRQRQDYLTKLRIADLSCGSGAFLVSAYQGLLQEHWRAQNSLRALDTKGKSAVQAALEDYTERKPHAAMLRHCLYGADLLPQAVEIAKLALWIRSARSGEKLANLGGNIVCTDSLQVEALFKEMHMKRGAFDLVLGNPPWGAELTEEQRRGAARELDLDPDHPWDSWELFVALSLEALREGGRLALVLPDTLLSPEKEATRRLILERSSLEKLHNLGPDWFGENVRMGTLILQTRKGPPNRKGNNFAAMVLHGAPRRQALTGEVPLSQLETRFSREIPQERCARHPTYDIELLRSSDDDRIMQRMDTHSQPLEEVCTRARGEEMSKTGLLWQCPSCAAYTTPGEKKKGGSFHDKACPQCGLTLTAMKARAFTLVEDGVADGIRTVTFFDGDNITERYCQLVPSRRLRIDIPNWDYKDASLYKGPKVLVRQAGVGVSATLDTTDARCPQSVYIYRLRPEMLDVGLKNELLLAAMSSRAMAYYVVKRFGEVDPARAFAKLTHERMSRLPIPKIDMREKGSRTHHDTIVQNVRSLVAGTARLGGPEDYEIELALRELWGLSAEDGERINNELRLLPTGQAIRSLFPGADLSLAEG